MEDTVLDELAVFLVEADLLLHLLLLGFGKRRDVEFVAKIAGHRHIPAHLHRSLTVRLMIRDS